MLAHNVYFALNDNSAEAVDCLVGACKKYLCDHPGVIFFAVGRLNPELAREVNDRDFDVALQVVFDNKASHDAYQEAPDHLSFIEKQKGNWGNVRVFDSDMEGASELPAK